MATQKDRDKAQAATPQGEEPQVELEHAGPVVPVLQGDGVGREDEKVNPAQDELQATVDEAEDKGYLGIRADQTPDHHYAVEGVIAGKPTPENPTGQKPGRV